MCSTPPYSWSLSSLLLVAAFLVGPVACSKDAQGSASKGPAPTREQLEKARNALSASATYDANLKAATAQLGPPTTSSSTDAYWRSPQTNECNELHIHRVGGDKGFPLFLSYPKGSPEFVTCSGK
jgi:hypothetical protein